MEEEGEGEGKGAHPHLSRGAAVGLRALGPLCPLGPPESPRPPHPLSLAAGGAPAPEGGPPTLQSAVPGLPYSPSYVEGRADAGNCRLPGRVENAASGAA